MDLQTSLRTVGDGGGYSHDGRTWPRRGRPNTLNFRPLRSANPGQSPDGSMDPSTFLLPNAQQRSGYVSPLRTVRTLKEYDQMIEDLRKENFNLKLRLYFLEKDMEKMTNPKEREALKVNLQLQIEAENLRKDVLHKSSMLQEAMVALEKQKETHQLEVQRSKESQWQLEEKIEMLKQELESERMNQTPRSSDTGSELYKQAFGIAECPSGKSSPECVTSADQQKLPHFSEVEKLRYILLEKDREIEHMKNVIGGLEEKMVQSEERVRKRNVAIQGFMKIIKDKEASEQPQGLMQESLLHAIKAAHSGNTEGVISNVESIRKGLSELLSISGCPSASNSLDDVESLKTEVARKDEVIKTLEEQLIEKTRKVRSLEESTSISSLPLESTKEFLDEQTRMISEHGKTVQSLVPHLQNQVEDSTGGKMKESDICESESLKMLQELICEKDVEIDVRKKTIELLNYQLAKCRSELQAAITDSEEKKGKLLELSSQTTDLENQLANAHQEIQTLRVKYHRLSVSNVSNEKASRLNTEEVNIPLIDFDDSIKLTSISEKNHASLTEIKELQRSLEESMPLNSCGSENSECYGELSSFQGTGIDNHYPPDYPNACDYPSAQQQSTSKLISESISVRTPRNETVQLTFNMSRKNTKSEKSDDLLDIMENRIQEFEHQKLLRNLEDRDVEIVRLGRHATLHEDMASVLAEDKKRLLQELEDKASEIQMLTATCSELEKQVIASKSQLHNAVMRADELERIAHDSRSKLKAPVEKSSSTSQTEDTSFLKDVACNTSLSSLNVTNFGQSDSVNTLKGEICILILVVEEREKEILGQKKFINKLESQLKGAVLQSGRRSMSGLHHSYTEGLSAVHNRLNTSHNLSNLLVEHLEEVARFMELLLPYDAAKELDFRSLTPDVVNSVMKHISDSIELTHNLSHNLTVCEESKIFDPDEYSVMLTDTSLGYPLLELQRSRDISLGGNEDFFGTEGSVLSLPLQQNADGTGKSCERLSIMQETPVMETVAETIDSDQLTILGASDSEEKSYLGVQEILDLSEETQNVLRNERCGDVKFIDTRVQESKEFMNYSFQNTQQFQQDLYHQNLSWYKQVTEQNIIRPYSCDQNKMDLIMPSVTAQTHNIIPYCTMSSDSDIWSEPDRNLSLQRIGIDTEAPSFHLRTPPKKRKSSRDRQISDNSSSASIAMNGTSKAKSYPRRKKSIGSSRRDTMEPRPDSLLENHLLPLGQSIENKLSYAELLSQQVQEAIVGMREATNDSSNQNYVLTNINEEILNIRSVLASAVEEVKILKGSSRRDTMEPRSDSLLENHILPLENKLSYVDVLSQHVQDAIAGMSETANETPDNYTLTNINKEILNIQTVLANAVEEVRILKGTTSESSQLPSDPRLTEELRLNNEELVNRIDNILEAKDLLVKERCAREAAEQNLILCRRELSFVRRRLNDAMLKLQQAVPLGNDQLLASRGIPSEPKEVYASSESDGYFIPADIDHLKKSLAQEEERNVFLNKQINDILNENKKLKIDLEQLQFRLMNEQKSLEEVRQQLMSEQNSVKQLSKDKNISENKSVDLAAEVLRIKSSLTELQDQNKALNKEVDDLLNENEKIKFELKESQTQLKSEREQLKNLSQEHLQKQESLSKLAKSKLETEDKIASLTAEMEMLKDVLSQKEAQNSSLSKQGNDLLTENWSLKKELEQVEIRLKNEVEHLEAVRKTKCDLHKQNMDLVAEKGDLEKKLQYSEERLKVLSDEKTDLSKQAFKKQRESKTLLDQIKILEDQKNILEKENAKYKTEIHSSDSVCDEARYDLKHTKEKLKKLELKLRQHENELTRVSSSNEQLLSEKKALEDELEMQIVKVTELSKQNGEAKKLLKERTSSYNETEREKCLLLDQVESLKAKKVQAESSRDKLMTDYDSLAAKVDSLEHHLKNSFLGMQKGKDEQEHLRQQTTSLQNKIKMKETVIKDLEEQHDVLHEQLKDLQHNLNKNDIDLKHLEGENQSLEKQVITLQKQLKKTSSRLEAKDEDISHLQEDIFSLEQKIKDKEAAQKRILDEKKISEEQILNLQQEVKKRASAQKQLKQQSAELEEQISGFQQQLQAKELLQKKSEDDVKALKGKIEEKEESIEKLESNLKKVEGKLSKSQEASMELQHKVKHTETARKHSEEQAEMLRKELTKLKEEYLAKTQKDGKVSTDRLSTVMDQLSSKEEYCKALENKVIEYQKQMLSLQREYDKPVSQRPESIVRSTERLQTSIIPNKVFSEPRSSQDYRIHTGNKIIEEKDYLIKGLELDNIDLKNQIEAIKKKLDIAESVKKDLEEENLSLWKTLYGSQDDKTHIIKTLEVKNSDLKNQIADFEKRIEAYEKSQLELEEEKNSLWRTLYGKEDDEADMIKRLEQKNKELKDQFEVVQSQLKDTEKSKEQLREEKDSLWKTLHGKKDEKTDLIKSLQLKNNDLKGQVDDLQKKLTDLETEKSELEEEKTTLWKTLYGKDDEKADITKMLEQKNNELKVNIEVLEKKLSHCEKARLDTEEKKNTLWKSLHGSQDEKTHAMKTMEEKNNELKNQIAVFETKLADADKLKAELEGEKNTMWKTLHGSEDEKADALQQMEIKNKDFKAEIGELKKKLSFSEKAKEEMEEEKNSLWRTLYGSEHEQADIVRNLEIKNNDLKGQIHVFEKKLETSEKIKKDLEERINSLRVTLYGSQDEKHDAVKSLEVKNNELIAEVEVLKGQISNLEKDKNEVEEEKASLWKTLCGNEDEKSNIMRQMEQKNTDLKDQIQILDSKLNDVEKSRKEIEEEKNSLWKTLYGSEHEQSDMIKKLELKNKELNSHLKDMETKLVASEKAQGSLEEEKGSLWKALHGNDDEKVHEIKALEMKNQDLKGQIEVLERKLKECEKLKDEFEEEKNSLWKNMYGSQDEKAATIKKLNIDVNNLKTAIKNVEDKLKLSEEEKNCLKEKKDSLDEQLRQMSEDNVSLTKKLELKDSDVKSQIKLLEDKLETVERVKKALEEDRNSLYSQLLGDSSGAKLEGMLKETQIYADQVKKLEKDITEKNAALSEMKEKLFTSENSLAAQQNAIERMTREISNCKMLLEKAYAEKEWFQNQYIESQRVVVRTAEPALTEDKINEEDMLMVHNENTDLKNQVEELLSQLSKKETPLTLPPIQTDLFTLTLPAPSEEKTDNIPDDTHSEEMKRAEMEKLHIEKNYLQKVLTDLKNQVQSQLDQHIDDKTEKNSVQKKPSDFSEGIIKQLALPSVPDPILRQEIEQLRSERDEYKSLVDKMKFEQSLREKTPHSFSEAENIQLHRENAELKHKLVELHDRIRKRESLIKALSDKIVELSQALKDSEATILKEPGVLKTDSISLLASQIAEQGAKTTEKSLSELFVTPDLGPSGFIDTEADTQLLLLLHPMLRQSLSGEREADLELDSKGVQQLRYRIEELENQLEDTRMDNYRLQEEVNAMLMKFGIQNNKLVCEKCGKSASVTAQPSGGGKAIQKFTSFRRYLEKDPMFSKEESINKLSECKWKLQNEVLNIQKKLCMNKQSLLEHQDNFNKHIEKMVAMEFPKIPVKIFSEPFLSTSENKDIVKNAERVHLLWKSQVLHLERDIKCLHNYRTFLEQFVFGVMKELTEGSKQKAVEKPDVIEEHIKISEDKATQPPVHSSFRIVQESGIPPIKVTSLPEARLKKSIQPDFPVSSDITEKTQPSASRYGSAVLVQSASSPFLIDEPLAAKESVQSDEMKSKSDVFILRNKVEELNKKIEGLQSENKRLQMENKKLAIECKKFYRSKNKEKQLEKYNEDLKQSLRDIESINMSLQVELDTYRQLLQADTSKEKPTEKHLDGYVRKSQVMKILANMKSLNLELDRLNQENNMLRKKLMHMTAPVSKSVKPRVLPREEESSSEKESEGTVTLSRSESLSSIDSLYKHELRPQKYEAPSKPFLMGPKVHRDKWDAGDLYAEEDTVKGKEKYGSVQESLFQRSHFSSPDLGIESDPNHELVFSEQAESDEKSGAKSHLPKQSVSLLKERSGKATADTITTTMWDTGKTAATVDTSLQTVGPLRDYTLLRKEIEESLVLVTGMLSRAKECLEYHERTASPSKNLGFSTLKDIFNSLKNLKVCQEKALRLVYCFQGSFLPSAEESLNVTTLLQENQKLNRKLEILMEEKKKQKLELHQAFERLKKAQEEKSLMEKAINKQLSRTRKVLMQAKSNLEKR